MGPLPQFERRSEDENESHEKPTWPWEKAPEGKEAKKKLDAKEEKEPKKKPEQPKKEKEEKKEPPKKEAKPEEPTQKPEEEKRERRATLVEQSLALVAKYEEEPIPRDAATLARLMIAHQVVHLNNQLEQTDIEYPLAPEEIEATLDYITKLDAKFKDPNAKVEPDVEQSYQEAMQLAQATLEEEPDLKTVIESLDTQQETNTTIAQAGSSRSPVTTAKYLQPETEPTSGPDSVPARSHFAGAMGEKANKIYTADRKGEQDRGNDQTEKIFDRRRQATKETIPAVATAASLIYLITHLGRKKPKQETVSNSGGDYSSSDTSSPSPQLPPPIVSSQSRSEQFTASRATTSSYAKRTAPFSGRERVNIPRRPSALATAAVATAFSASRTSQEAPRITQPTPNEHAQFSHRETPQPPRHEVPQPEETTAKTDRKIEHMPLLQLLSMAGNVDIGHGHYLRREFESGRIDREGLVKILKAHSKGRDYQFEFRQQASQFAKLKESSPEFLHQPKPTRPTTEETSEESHVKVPEPQPESVKKKQVPARPLSLAPPAQHELLPEFTGNTHQPQHTARRLILITIASLIGLDIVGWVAVAIFNALN